jgi:hypothetical protein
MNRIPTSIICQVQYGFVGTIHVKGGPGPVTFQWMRSDGYVQTQTLSAAAGENLFNIPMSWLLTAPNGAPEWVRLMIMSPTPTYRQYDFTHQCSTNTGP